MVEKPDDILVDIPDDDLPLLVELYREHRHGAPHVLNFFNIAIRWKKSEKYRNCVTVMAPNGNWKEDGTFIALIEIFSYDLFMFTLDENCKNLCYGLKNTNRLSFDNNRTVLFCLQSIFVPHVVKTLQEKDANLSFLHDPCFMFCTSIEESKDYKVECTSDMYLKELEPSNATQIDALWPHHYPGSDRYIAALIKLNGGYGLFLKSTNEMVSWMLIQCMGNMGMFQTEEAHQKKGYGALVTKRLSLKAAEIGILPCATVSTDNVASKAVFRKLHFKDVGRSTYIIVTGRSYLNCVESHNE